MVFSGSLPKMQKRIISISRIITDLSRPAIIINQSIKKGKDIQYNNVRILVLLSYQ